MNSRPSVAVQTAPQAAVDEGIANPSPLTKLGNSIKNIRRSFTGIALTLGLAGGLAQGCRESAGICSVINEELPEEGVSSSLPCDCNGEKTTFGKWVLFKPDCSETEGSSSGPTNESSEDSGPTLPSDTAVDSGSGSDTVDDGSSGQTVADESSGEPEAVCNNDVVEGDEVCDGTDVGGATCEDEGFEDGTVVCNETCSDYDFSDCSTCNNDVVEGDEVCDGTEVDGINCQDLGFEDGTVACNGDCTDYDFSGCSTCGNGNKEGEETCDGLDTGEDTCVTEGFDAGMLECNDDCMSFDTTDCSTCGDGTVGTGEQCDGVNLDGFTCEMIGQVGEPVCLPNCMVDPTSCMPPPAESEEDALTLEQQEQLIAQWYAQSVWGEACYPESQ